VQLAGVRGTIGWQAECLRILPNGSMYVQLVHIYHHQQQSNIRNDVSHDHRVSRVIVISAQKHHASLFHADSSRKALF
jgi:hypothetical protein